MGQPSVAFLRIARRPEITGEADLGCVAVDVRQTGKRHILAQWNCELRLQRALRLADRTRLILVLCARIGVRVAPLHDIVVLRAQEHETIEILFAHQRLDVRRMARRE
jgi:hypothetical protein